MAAPTQPTCSVSYATSSGIATVTCAGSDAGTDNSALYREWKTGSWASKGPIVGDGDITLTVGVELTANTFYEVCVSSVDGDTNAVSNIVIFWSESAASEHKAILDRIEALVQGLGWSGWTNAQIEVAWSPDITPGMKHPRVVICPSNEPEDYADRTNVEFAAVYPTRIYLFNRLQGRKGGMEDLLHKREQLCKLFKGITILHAVAGVYLVEVVPFAVVLDDEVARNYYAAGISVRVHVNDVRGA